MAELGETATLDSGPQHDHGIGHTWIRRLDRLPRGFQSCDESRAFGTYLSEMTFHECAKRIG